MQAKHLSNMEQDVKTHVDDVGAAMTEPPSLIAETPVYIRLAFTQLSTSLSVLCVHSVSRQRRTDRPGLMAEIEQC